jgi:phosphoribosylpyrophosphate synthetase
MITRTATDCDINFIPNCNTQAADDNEALENALVSSEGALRPGIIYAAFAISRESDSESSSESASAAELSCKRLRAAGADAILDTDLHAGASWAGFPASAVCLLESGPTVLVRDLNGTIVRLVPQ